MLNASRRTSRTTVVSTPGGDPTRSGNPATRGSRAIALNKESAAATPIVLNFGDQVCTGAAPSPRPSPPEGEGEVLLLVIPPPRVAPSESCARTSRLR